MGQLIKFLVKGIQFLLRPIGKLILLFIPKSVKDKRAQRRRDKRKRVTPQMRWQRLRPRAVPFIVLGSLLLLPGVMLALSALYNYVLFPRDPATPAEPKDSDDDSGLSGWAVFGVLMMFVAPFVGYYVLRAGLRSRKMYKLYPRYAAALWWEPECSTAEFTQRLHAQWSIKHLGAPSYFSVQPESILHPRNRTPKPLQGRALKRQMQKVQKNLLMFLKKQFFPGAYMNLHQHHIGNLKLDAQRKKNAELLADKPILVRLRCVDCGTEKELKSGTVGRCAECGAPLLERL
ncbi:MAG: hypothetical protein LBN05_03200 [Oscillospiraceae bacterium]|nr:hypothetical protein [Oscillospiraceae bacterium]